MELVCGALFLLRVLTRLAAIPLIIDTLVAFVTTKLPILIGHDLGPFHAPSTNRYGFWSMAHEMHTDWAMLLGCIFLLLVGAGHWSLDARLTSGGRTGRVAADH